ncbi:MAG: hypothetical protein JW829_10395 [Pirellulales bacterium]|nr:hypothetical protein [Pirellulales bacterium]
MPIGFADVYQWINDGTGFYTDTANWHVISGTGSPPPSSSDVAVFDVLDVPGGYNVVFLSEETNDSFELEANDVLFLPEGTDRLYLINNNVTISGGSLTLGADNLALNLTVGDTLSIYSGGSLKVTNRSVVTTKHLSVAADYLLPGAGMLSVDGAGSGLVTTGTGPYEIGNYLNGVLSFHHGAAGTISGPLHLGTSTTGTVYGHGALRIDGDSQVMTADITVGGGMNRSGEIYLDGADSQLTQSGAAFLQLGGAIDRGTGVVNITGGAGLITGTGGLRIYPTGSILMEGNSSELQVNGNVLIDGGDIVNRTRPSLSVSNGSSFSMAANSTFAADHRATADFLSGLTIANQQTYFLRGYSKMTTGGTFTVGGDSQGTIDIAGGTLEMINGANILENGIIRLSSGVISANQHLRISGGNVTLLGSAFTQGANLVLTVENGGQISFEDPVGIWPGRRFEVTSGGRLNANKLNVSTNSQLYVGDGGTLAVEAIDYAKTTPFPMTAGSRLEMDSFIGTLNIPYGTVTPGREYPAGATISGNYIQQAPVALEIEIGGTVPGQEYDQLLVDGDTQLDGELEVYLVDLGSGLYVPQAGDLFELICSGTGLTGQFAQVKLPDIAAGLAWSLQYDTHSVLLEVLETMPSDFNRDGIVDRNDLDVWQDGFGLSDNATPNQGDADFDHDVDGADFLVWQRDLGTAASASGSQTAIPEPAAMVLMILVMGGLSLRWIPVSRRGS